MNVTVHERYDTHYHTASAIQCCNVARVHIVYARSRCLTATGATANIATAAAATAAAIATATAVALSQLVGVGVEHVNQ
jgi:hypothetical protein